MIKHCEDGQRGVQGGSAGIVSVCMSCTGGLLMASTSCSVHQGLLMPLVVIAAGTLLN